MRSKHLLAFVAVVAPMASVVEADPITIRITGRIAEVDDIANALEGAITPSMPFAGEYTYDSQIADESTDPTVGRYTNRFPPSAIRIKVGGLTFQSDAADLWMHVEVVDRTRDNYLVRSYTNLPVAGLYVDHIAWQLDDPSGQAIAGDALPLTAPVLTQWTSIFGLTIDGVRPSRIGGVPQPGFPPMGDRFFIRGHVESAVVAPSTASSCGEVASGVPGAGAEDSELPCDPDPASFSEQPPETLVPEN